MKLSKFIFIIMIHFWGQTQEIELDWLNSVSHNNNFWSKKSLINELDSCIYTIGVYTDFMEIDQFQISTPYQKSIFLLKTNQLGQTIWLKSIANLDFSTDISTKVAITNNNEGNMIAGISFNDKLYFEEDSIVITNDSFNQGVGLIKLDTTGIILWNKKIFVDNLGRSGILIDNMDNILLTGSVSEDFFISKYTSNGDSLWTQFGGSSGGYDTGTELKIDSENNIYAIGTIQPNNSIYFDTYHPTFNPIHSDGSFLAKYDQNGIIQWVRCFYATNFGEFTTAYSLDLLSDNQIIIGGSFNGAKINFYPNSVALSGNTSENNTSFLLSYDSLGNLLWKKKPHNNFSGTDGVRNINKTPIGEFLLICSYNYSIIILDDTLISNASGGKVIEKFDSNGNLQWYYPFKSNSSSNIMDFYTLENDYLLIGSSVSNEFYFNEDTFSLNNNPNIFLIKLNNNLLSINENQLITFTLFPNPTSSGVTLTSKESLLGKEVSIYNTLGELMSRQKMNHLFENEILLPESTGIYFIRINELNFIERVVKN